MPSPDEILAGLSEIANRGFIFALAWHLLVVWAVAALWYGWRPSPRLAGALLITPLASVSAFAWAFHNPFNGAFFALLSVVLAVAVWRAPVLEVQRHGWATVLGAVLVAFGCVYPHFLEGTALAYPLAAPLGLIPCPTLSLVIGFSLLGFGPAGRPWQVALTAAGLFYAVFGAVRLNVLLDLWLLVGAAGLALRDFHPGRRRLTLTTR